MRFQAIPVRRASAPASVEEEFASQRRVGRQTINVTVALIVLLPTILRAQVIYFMKFSTTNDFVHFYIQQIHAPLTFAIV